MKSELRPYREGFRFDPSELNLTPQDLEASKEETMTEIAESGEPVTRRQYARLRRKMRNKRLKEEEKKKRAEA